MKCSRGFSEWADDEIAVASRRRGAPVTSRRPRRRAGARVRRRVGRILRPASRRARCRRREGRATRGIPVALVRAVRRRRARSRPQPRILGGQRRQEIGRGPRRRRRSSTLCASADVMVHTLRARRSHRSEDSTSHPCTRLSRELVVCAVTPFGQSGPWAEYLADDLVLMALGGSMAACGYRPAADGTYDTPPLASMGDQAWRTASTYAAIAVLAARLLQAGSSGAGQFIDVSAHECSASMTEWHLLSYICSGFRLPARSASDPHRNGRQAGRRARSRLPRSPRLRPSARDARAKRRRRPAVGPGVPRPGVQGDQLQRALAGVEATCRQLSTGRPSTAWASPQGSPGESSAAPTRWWTTRTCGHADTS